MILMVYFIEISKTKSVAMNKRMVITVLGLILVFGGLLGFNLVKKKMMADYFANYTPPAVSISTVTAKKSTWHPVIESVGNFVAINGVDVSSQSSGNVTSLEFVSGQFVKKGTSLITIDDSIDQASLKDAQANLTLQKVNYKRQVDLYKRQATSSSNVDTAKANLSEAAANVEKIQAEINQKHIKAPFTGRLGVRKVNLGEFINPGSTKIVTLQSLDPLYLEFYLPEQYLRQLHVDQEIRFQVESHKTKQFTGKITAINSKIDVNTHNVLIQATLANCPLQGLSENKTKLIATKKDVASRVEISICDSKKNEANNVTKFAFTPGMFAKIDVVRPPLGKVIILPRSAISYSLYGNSVFIVKEEQSKKSKKTIKKVYKQFVTTGEERGNSVIIAKGVTEGEVIVNSGQLKLHDGTTVTINNEVKLKDITDPDSLGQ